MDRAKFVEEAARNSYIKMGEKLEQAQATYQTDIDKRIQKLEIRLEDVSNRLAAQQIKR